MRPRTFSPALLALVLAACAALTMACEDVGPAIIVSPEAQNLPAVQDANGCTKDAARDMKAKVEPVINRFNEAVGEATKSSGSDRSGLPAAIEGIQTVRDEFAALEVADCARRAHETFVAYMDLNVNLYENIRDGTSNAGVTPLLEGIIAAQIEPEAAWSVIFQKAGAE